MKDRAAFLSSWTVFLVIFFVLMVAVNVLFTRLDVRWDLTKDKIYTVSPATENILANLQDIITIQYYVSEDLPTGLQRMSRDTIDYLNDYGRLADGKVRVEVVNPERLIADYVEEKEESGESDPDESTSAFNPFGGGPVGPKEEKEAELRQMGVPKLSGRVVENDRMEVVSFFSSILVKYLDKPTKAIEIHQSLEGLEYELANRILELTQTEKPKVAFFLGQPDLVREVPHPQSPQLPPIKQHPYSPLLEQVFAPKFDVQEIALQRDSGIPADARLLIVAQPHGLEDRQVYEIDRHIAGGGSALFLITRNTGDIESGQFPLSTLHPRLDRVFEKWGIQLGNEFVMSELCGPIVQQRMLGGSIPVNTEQALPVFPLAPAQGLNQESPLTQGLEFLSFPFATPLHHDSQKLVQNDLDLVVLAKSEERSWLAGWQPALSQDMFQPPSQNGKPVFAGPQDLAYLLSGVFPSSYREGEPIPAWKSDAKSEPQDGPDDTNGSGSGESGTTENDAEPAVETAPAIARKPARVVVLSSSDMAKITFLGISRTHQVNIGFLQGIVESIALGEELLEIRRKTQTARPLEELKRGRKSLIFYGNFLGVPLLLLVLGIGRAMIRRSGATRYEDSYQRKQAKGGAA